VAGSAIADAFRMAKGFFPVIEDEFPALGATSALSIVPPDLAPAP
jgi:hypothetical protein